MVGMKEDLREIQRKLRILQHAAESGNVSKTCRYFGIGRASFYRWQTAYRKLGGDGLINRKPIPKQPAKKTAPEIEEKVLHLRRAYHLGPMRIAWSLKRYHDIRISDANVYRILRRVPRQRLWDRFGLLRKRGFVAHRNR
jgi:transposase